jgi:hypothetical protein
VVGRSCQGDLKYPSYESKERMVRVSAEVREGAARFRVAVRAESIRRAVRIMKGRNPGRDVRIVFRMDPEEERDGSRPRGDNYGLFTDPYSDAL